MPSRRDGREGKTVRKSIFQLFFLRNVFLSVSFFSSIFLIEVGDMAKQYIEKGLLVPDHLITRLMLSELENRRGQHWLLDGEFNLWVPWAFLPILGHCFLAQLHTSYRLQKMLSSPKNVQSPK